MAQGRAAFDSLDRVQIPAGEPHQDQSDPVDQVDHGILLWLTEELPVFGVLAG